MKMLSWRRLSKQKVFALCLVLMSGCLTANETESRDIRVLLTFGGHGFQQKPFFEMFDNLPGIKYTRAPMPESVKLLRPGLEKEYDVIVMYDMVESISDEQRKAFVRLLKRGIGVVALHHNLCAHRDWDDFRRIIGGQYLFAPKKINGKEYGKSTFAHGQEIDVKVVDRNHPVTKGVTEFQIHDETYKHCYVSTNTHVLLATDHPKSNRQLAWVTRYENSPVFYLMLGHDSKAWQHPAYPQLLLNGIRWTRDQIEDKEAEQGAEGDAANRAP